MPVRLRNKSKDAMEVKHELGAVVEPNEIADVPGEVVSESDDAVVIAGPNGERAWPKSTWALVSSAKPKKDEE